MVRGNTRYRGVTVGLSSCVPKPASLAYSGSGPEGSVGEEPNTVNRIAKLNQPWPSMVLVQGHSNYCQDFLHSRVSPSFGEERRVH
jgi:hypothetical protein